MAKENSSATTAIASPKPKVSTKTSTAQRLSSLSTAIARQRLKSHKRLATAVSFSGKRGMVHKSCLNVNSEWKVTRFEYYLCKSILLFLSPTYTRRSWRYGPGTEAFRGLDRESLSSPFLKLFLMKLRQQKFKWDKSDREIDASIPSADDGGTCF